MEDPVLIRNCSLWKEKMHLSTSKFFPSFLSQIYFHDISQNVPFLFQWRGGSETNIKIIFFLFSAVGGNMFKPFLLLKICSHQTTFSTTYREAVALTTCRDWEKEPMWWSQLRRRLPSTNQPNGMTATNAQRKFFGLPPHHHPTVFHSPKPPRYAQNIGRENITFPLYAGISN